MFIFTLFPKITCVNHGYFNFTENRLFNCLLLFVLTAGTVPKIGVFIVSMCPFRTIYGPVRHVEVQYISKCATSISIIDYNNSEEIGVLNDEKTLSECC